VLIIRDPCICIHRLLSKKREELSKRERFSKRCVYGEVTGYSRLITKLQTHLQTANKLGSGLRYPSTNNARVSQQDDPLDASTDVRPRV
jgi:hypothetical protein